MRAHPFCRPLPVLVGAFGLAVLTAVTASGQGQLASEAEIKKNFSNQQTNINAHIRGDVGAKDLQAAVDAAADYYTLRLAAGKFTTGAAARFQYDAKNFIDNVVDPLAAKSNKPFRDRLSPAVVDRLQRVFAQEFATDLDARLSIINTAQVLPQFARLRDEAIGEHLVELMRGQVKGAKKAKDDGPLQGPELVKMYAARGLKSFFPARGISEDDLPFDKKLTALKMREVAYVDSLVALIERKHVATLEKIEQDAIRFVRREALESLASSERPAIVAVYSKQNPKVPLEGQVAPTLWRVLAPKTGGMQPEPGLAERIEAAIGVCQIRYLKQKAGERYECLEYDPTPSPYLVGMLLADFGDGYMKEKVRVETKQPTTLPWKETAKRLEVALQAFAANAKGGPISAQASQLETTAKGAILDPIQKGQGLAQLTPFRDGVKAYKPKTPVVHAFRTLQGAGVTIEAGAAPPTPPAEEKKAEKAEK